MVARRKLPPLNALKAFEAAARLGGFTAAGEELFVSPGAVSRHVSNLESFLGVALFKRGHNEVFITAEGQRYLSHISAALAAIEQASSGVAPVDTQSLNIHALPTFAEFWLLPRLGGFRALHPEARLQLSTSLEETDWDTDRADISIYASVGGWNERGTQLFETRIRPVCGPRALSQWAEPSKMPSPHELLRWPLISSVNKTGDWLRWFHACGLQPDAAEPQYVLGNSALAYKAAAHGLGTVCAETLFVSDALADGRLVALSDVVAPGSSYFVEVRPGKQESLLSRSFQRWIVETAADT